MTISSPQRPRSDVVIENFKVGALAKFGLDAATLRAANPRLIYASISGFGQTGPLSSKTSFDMIAQAYTGIMAMTGEEDGPPALVGLGISDTTTGVHAFAAIGFALFLFETRFALRNVRIERHILDHQPD